MFILITLLLFIIFAFIMHLHGIDVLDAKNDIFSNKEKGVIMEFMKKYGTYLLIGFAIVVGLLTSIIDTGAPSTQKVQTNPEYEVQIAPDFVVENFKEGVLNKGYSIKGNIYYTRSKDYAKVYMFGALVEKRGDIYNCVWANNEKDSTGVFESMNDYAIQVSGIPSSGHMSTLDDGYSRINQKLLDDWNNY